MKWTMPKLRLRAWRILTHPDTRIALRKIKGPSAYGIQTGTGGVEIAIDPYKTNIPEAVVHEIFHVIFDPHTNPFATYEIYEQWYTILEKSFFKGMTRKDRARWRKAIEKKMPKRSIPIQSKD